ncbi:alpha/beta fold hydrolase [Pseudomonas sp. BMS12]|uniref:alpha/beta fold hydrolase n=1 Tax=Pseudomonas sp. BMS12 TaxID=1796033 RepID=UPI00083A76F4|nr:alpha/beta fold hydrolase [Pseudomonas sp. BMS12]
MVDVVAFADGKFHCPVTLYSAPAARYSLVLLPALGVTARKYESLARCLVAAGHNVLVADWPGQGESFPRPGWRFNYGYRQLVEEFLPKLLDLARQQFPAASPILLGHSLGGHMATLHAAARAQQDAVPVIGVACGNIHYRHWQGLGRLLTPSVAVLFTLISSVLGYLPGRRLGFGGQEARQLMRDWGRVAFSGHFRHLGLALTPAEQNRVRSLFIQLEGDNFAPPASTRGLAALIQAEPQLVHLPSPRPPSENPHSAWLRAPQSVVACIDVWLARELAVSAESATAG